MLVGFVEESPPGQFMGLTAKSTPSMTVKYMLSL